MGKIQIKCNKYFKECSLFNGLTFNERYNYECYTCINIKELKNAKRDYVRAGGLPYDYVSVRLDGMIIDLQNN